MRNRIATASPHEPVQAFASPDRGLQSHWLTEAGPNSAGLIRLRTSAPPGHSWRPSAWVGGPAGPQYKFGRFLSGFLGRTKEPIAGRMMALAAVLVSAAAGQAPLAIPVNSDGIPEPPPGVQLERVGVIETLAGSGEEGFGGDQGPALEASFSFPRSLAVDSAGSVYVADTRNHRIRKIDSSGIVSTFAGNGERRWRPLNDEGDQAAEVALHFPTAVVADPGDNLYLLDTWNHQIRRIDSAGAITTFTGNGGAGFGGDGGPAANALLNIPTGLAMDTAGNIYIADSGNHRIRKIDSSGTISTIAGTGRSGYGGDGGSAVRADLANPSAVAADASGNIFIADTWNHRIRKIDSSGTISTVAGTGGIGDSGDGGPGLSAQLAYPVAVASGLAGETYVITYVRETGNNRVRRIDADGTISAFAGSAEEGFGGDGGPAPEAQLSYPTGVCADASGVVYLADSLNARIRAVRPGSQVTVPLGDSGESVALVVSHGGVLTRGGMPVLNGSKLSARNGNEYSLTAEPSGAILATYVPEVQRISLAGSSVTLTTREDGTWWIDQVRAENGHRHLHNGREYVLELWDGTWGLAPYVARTVAGNTEVADGVPAVEASLHRAEGLAVDSLGNVYVAEPGNDRVRRIDPSGFITTVAGTGDWGFGGDGEDATDAELWDPVDVATWFGNIYVADSRNNRIRRIDRSGTIATIAGTGQCCTPTDGGQATETRLFPGRLAADHVGNLFVSARYRVHRIDRSGTLVTIAGSGSSGYSGDGGPATQARFSYEPGIAVDRSGSVYIADRSNHRVRKVDRSGTITTIAGTGDQGYNGDGIEATSANLSRPAGVAAHRDGTVYVADTGNRRVRKIDSAGLITTVAGTGDWGFSGDGGPATEADIASPIALALSLPGSLYMLADNRVRKIDRSGNITTIAGNGDLLDGIDEESVLPHAARFSSPASVALDLSGNVLVGDSYRIWRVDSAGSVSVFAGSGLCCYGGIDGPATEARLSNPRGQASDTAGNLYVASGQRVLKIDASGIITTIAGTGDYGFAGDGGPATEAQFRWPEGLATDTLGNVYIADQNNHRIRRVDALGRITTIAGTGDRGFGGDGGPATEAELSNPIAVATDHAGRIYVAERFVGRIRAINSSGVITTLADIPESVSSLALDRSGNLFVGARNRILKVALNDGTVETVAGTGEPGLLGDGGPSRSAHLSVDGLAVDRWGNVWFADREGRRVRVLERQPLNN